MNIIIGGGIAGLTTALAFEKLDIPFQIYERSKEVGRVGAGIWLAPNALKVFNWLGILDELANEGNTLKQASVRTNTFKPIFETENEIEFEGKPLVSLAIHRARLQAFLISKLSKHKLHLSKEFERLSVNGEEIEVCFKDGQKQGFNSVIGADGIHSKVRNQIFPNSGKRYSRQTCWRGISNIELPDEFLHKGLESWGRGIRFGFSRIARKEVYWFAVQTSQENGPDLSKDRLIKMFSTFHPLVTEIIDNTSEVNIIKSDLHDLKHNENWFSDRICLIGDAAHATTPNMGQGGCQAVEDAYYLSHCMKKYSEPVEAFRKFQEIRIDKVRNVVRQSWTLGKMAHWKYGKGIRNYMLSKTPRRIVKKSMEKLYAITPPDQI